MAINDVENEAGDKTVGMREKLIGVYIGCLAVVLAICSLGGDNAAKDATLKNIEAANTWAFFQAKNARRQMLLLQVDSADIAVRTASSLKPEDRLAIDKKLAAYQAKIKELTSEPETGEGLDELFKKGKAMEADRDIALQRDPYFDYGEALLQIAIVLASVSIISGGYLLLAISFVLGGMGAIATIGGFTLAIPLPF